MRALLVAHESIHRGALSAARALKKAGWFVGCTSDDRRSLAAASRATDRWHYTPSPADDLDAFLDSVQAAVDEGGYDVLLPGGDAETLALSIGRDRVNALIPYPSHEMSWERSTSLISSSERTAPGLQLRTRSLQATTNSKRSTVPSWSSRGSIGPPGHLSPAFACPLRLCSRRTTLPNGSPTSARWAASHSYKRSFEDASCTATSSWSEMDG
jgi:hypothetical protein